LVAQWSASFENGFKDGASATWLGGAVTEMGSTTVGGASAWTGLRWGPDIGNGLSGIDVTPGVQGGGSSVPVFTNQPHVDTVAITHLNRVIGCTRGFPTGAADPDNGTICLNALKDTILLTNLALTAIDFPMNGVNTPLPPQPVVEIDIRFVETFNQANPADCAFLEQGTPPPSGPCKDIFVVLDPLDLSFSFVFADMIEYFVEIGSENLVDLSPAACALAGLPAGCRGLTTPEGSDTTILTNIRIFTKVPEPGTLAILAIGLLGIGVVTRRKNA
jgi:hypothetical protein